MAQVKPISGVDDRVQLADALPLKSPFTLNVFPTNACNFRCSYCAHALGDKKLEETYGVDKSLMSVSTMEAVVEQSKRLGPYKLLLFLGHGEPLIHKDLPKMIELASKAGIANRIEIITNASLLTHDLTDRLIDSGLTNLRVSLQGISSDMYRKTSGVSLDFDRFIERLVYFYNKKKPHMGLFVKVMDVSLDTGEDEKFYAMFDNICDRMYVESVQPVYHAVNIQEGTDSGMRYDRYGNAHPPRNVCPLIFFSLSVWPNGDVQPCDAIYKPCNLGNVHSTTLSEMWQGSTLNDFRIAHLSGKKAMQPGCINCCAPDDVSHPADVLDGHEARLINKF